MPAPPSGPLLGVRTALVILLAVLAGVAAGWLSFLASHSLPAATLAGGSAAGGALLLFEKIIGQLHRLARWSGPGPAAARRPDPASATAAPPGSFPDGSRSRSRPLA